MDSHWLRRLRIVCFLPLLAADSALAYPPTYGTEFNFVSPQIDEAAKWRLPGQLVGKAEHDLAEAMVREVRKRCPKCHVEIHKGKFNFDEYKVTVPDGSWWFNIAIDPSCVEVQTSPGTAKQIAAQVGEMKKYIFDSAKGAGLFARSAGDLESSTAHLNIGARSAFEDDVKGFMRYIVDYQNRAALGAGVLGDDYANAPLLSELKPAQREAFQNLVDDVNGGKVETIEILSRRMNHEVYTWTPTFNQHGLSSGQHYQALGMKQLIKPGFAEHDMPFELRAIRMPETPEEYQLLTELMDARIDFVKKQEGPIRFVDSTKVEMETYRAMEQVKALEFHLFTTELGRNPKKYESLVTPGVRKVLRTTLIERVLSGNAKMSNRVDAALVDSLAKGALTSHATEAAFVKVLKAQKKPAKMLTALLDRLYEDAQLNAETAAIILERTKQTIALAASHGVVLEVAPEDYLDALFDLTKPPTFAQKCSRFFRAPLRWFN